MTDLEFVIGMRKSLKQQYLQISMLAIETRSEISKEAGGKDAQCDVDELDHNISDFGMVNGHIDKLMMLGELYFDMDSESDQKKIHVKMNECKSSIDLCYNMYAELWKNPNRWYGERDYRSVEIMNKIVAYWDTAIDFMYGYFDLKSETT